MFGQIAEACVGVEDQSIAAAHGVGDMRGADEVLEARARRREKAIATAARELVRLFNGVGLMGRVCTVRVKGGGIIR